MISSGCCIDCLWDGTPELRAIDTPKLYNDGGFDTFASHVRSQAATDPNSVDAKWLDACKGLGAKVIVIPNTLQPAQYQALVAKYPDTIIGMLLQDDANTKTPAEVTAAYNAIKPFLGSTQATITVGKGTKHADYGGLVPWYHVQNYIGKAILVGDGMKKYAYDEMLLARQAVPATGKLYGSMYLPKNITPYFGRRDPVWTANEYALPSTQEAVAWLQLMAGADHLLNYTAYTVPNIGGITFVGNESRLAERWDLLPGYKAINSRIRSLDRFLSGGVRTTRVDGKNCIGEWKLPSGEKLTVTVDLTTEFYPRTDWQIETPIPSVSTTVRITSSGPVKIETLP